MNTVEVKALIDNLICLSKDGDLSVSFSGNPNFLIECQLNIFNDTWDKSYNPSKLNSIGDILTYYDKDGKLWKSSLKGEQVVYKKHYLTVIFEI